VSGPLQYLFNAVATKGRIAQAIGRGFEELAQIEIEANGHKVLGGQISLSVYDDKGNYLGERIADRLVRWRDGRETFTEVKAGPNSDHTDRQRALDLQVQKGNFVPHGPNAVAAGLKPVMGGGLQFYDGLTLKTYLNSKANHNHLIRGRGAKGVD
jgi:hypothetical protein